MDQAGMGSVVQGKAFGFSSNCLVFLSRGMTSEFGKRTLTAGVGGKQQGLI